MKLFPGLDEAFLALLADHTAGDPQQGRLWTNLSQRQIAAQLKGRGFFVSVTVVTQLLRRHRLGRRKAQKTQSMGQHKDRDQQFGVIARLRQEYKAASLPILSVDSKKKELLGDLFREGHTYTQEVIRCFDHDYPSAAVGVVYPHGLYDVQHNVGHLNLGISHDTSRFCCDSIAWWWENHGRHAWPEATSLLLLCDGGGSNSSRRYLFKHALEQLADRLDLEIRVAHYPPYTSKYNPIEHRFFPHVSRACRGMIFTNVEQVMHTMAKANTTQGLQTTVHLLQGDYPLGEKVPENYKQTMRILFDEELPAWNYRAVPDKKGT